MKAVVYTPVLLMGMLFASGIAQAEMYKWTDKNGKTHYTATPPPADAEGKNISDEIRLSTGKLGNIPAQADKPAAKTGKTQSAAEKSEKKHRDFCQQQDTALNQMKENSLIKWKDAQGERFLTADEKIKKMKEIEQNIEGMCRPEMFAGKEPGRQTSSTEMAVGERFSKENNQASLSGGGQKAGNAGATGSTGSSSTPGSTAENAPGAGTDILPLAN